MTTSTIITLIAFTGKGNIDAYTNMELIKAFERANINTKDGEKGNVGYIGNSAEDNVYVCTIEHFIYSFNNAPKTWSNDKLRYITYTKTVETTYNIM